MIKLGSIGIFGVLVATQVMLVGCGSGESSSGGGLGSPPDFVALEGKLTQPSGTFAAGQEGAVQDGFGNQSAAAQGSPFGGGSGTSSTKSNGDLTTQSLHPLDGTNTCPGLENGGQGTCACPNGGSLDYDVPANVAGKPGQDPNGTVDQTVSLVAHTCGTNADQTVDGSIYWKIKNPPPMQLFSVHLKMTGKTTASYDVEYLNKNGVVTFAVEVADGHVLVSAKGNWDKSTKTGTLVITDKNDTWTCEMVSGKGTCKSAKGESRSVG
jgi:hypothetical protein